jgi:hypothetical protein
VLLLPITQTFSKEQEVGQKEKLDLYNEGDEINHKKRAKKSESNNL